MSESRFYPLFIHSKGFCRCFTTLGSVYCKSKGYWYEVRTLKNIETGKKVNLTEEEYQRFFDNNNPCDWAEVTSER